MGFGDCPCILLENSSGIVGAACRAEQGALELPTLQIIYLPLNRVALFPLPNVVFFSL